MSRTVLLTLVSVGCLAAITAPPANAEERGSYETRIAYGDLNLDSAAGADAMLRRIRHAARDACGDSHVRMTLNQHVRMRACTGNFVQRAVAELANDNVTARFNGLRGVTLAQR